MIGTLVNAAAVLLGGICGCLFKKALPVWLGDAVMKVLGLCVLYLGITGLSGDGAFLVVILSLVCGVLIGELLRLDDGINALGKWLEHWVSRGKGDSMVANGFVTASLLFCVGAMAILGPLQDGLTGDHSTLFVKSLLDGISAIIFASTFGVGVLFSAAAVLVYQGAIALLAVWIAPLLIDNTYLLAQIDVVGALLLVALSLNMLGITKLKVMNMVPALFMPLWLCLLIPA